MSIRETGAFLLWYFVIVTQCRQVSGTCRDSVEMGESPFMRDGWAVLQPTLTAQPSRSTQRTGPAVLLFLGSPLQLQGGGCSGLPKPTMPVGAAAAAAHSAPARPPGPLSHIHRSVLHSQCGAVLLLIDPRRCMGGQRIPCCRTAAEFYGRPRASIRRMSLSLWAGSLCCFTLRG
eukprot:COSAG01_NODE_1136_length_11548_cov_30.375404_17_plen_175_part_00